MKTSAPARRALSLLLAQRLIGRRTGRRRGRRAGSPAPRRRRGRALHRLQADGGARARRPPRGAARGGARGAGAPLARRRRERSGVDRRSWTSRCGRCWHRRSPTRRWRCSSRWARRASGWAAPRRSRRRRWRPARSVPRWRRSCGCTTTTTIRIGSCRTWRARPSPPLAPAIAPAFARTFRLLAGQEDRLEGDDDKKTASKGNTKADKKGDRADEGRQGRQGRQDRQGRAGRSGSGPGGPRPQAGAAGARRRPDRLGGERESPREAPRRPLGQLAARAAGRRARRVARRWSRTTTSPTWPRWSTR